MNTDLKLTENPQFIPVDAELDAEYAQKLEAAAAVDAEFNFKLSSRRDERFLAFYLLYAVDRADYSISLEEALENFEGGFEAEVPHNSYSLTLVRGALVHRDELDAYLVPFLKNWPLERLGCCTRLILRLAVWELKQEHSISSIVINEAIELAKAFAEKDAYRFINGILDEVAKELGKPVAQEEVKA